MTEPTTSDPGATRAVWLIGRREFRTSLRGRPVLIGTAGLAVVLAAFLVVCATAFAAPQPLRVGLTGQAIALQGELPQDTATLGVTVAVSQVASSEDGVAQLRSGDLDVLVSGPRAALHVTVSERLDPRLRATLNSLVRQQVLDAQIAQLGLKPDDVLSRVDQAGITLTELRAADADHGGRVAVGLVTATLLAAALALFGTLAARGVAADKEHRTAEALLTIVRPRRLLLGNLAGVGAVGAVQVLALGLLGLALSVVTGTNGLYGNEFAALGSGLLWYVVGFGLYGTAFAVGGALAVRPAELRTALWTVGGAVAASFVVGFVLLAADPDGAAAAVLSVLPPFAPILMAGRMAIGVATGWQIVLALVLTLAGVAGLAWFGGRVYVAAMPNTAGRIRLRDALR